jgi:hypothetical protein
MLRQNSPKELRGHWPRGADLLRRQAPCPIGGRGVITLGPKWAASGRSRSVLRHGQAAGKLMLTLAPKKTVVGVNCEGRA